MQLDRDIGFLCHAPYTNSKQLHRVVTGSRALSNAFTLHALAVRNCIEPEPVYGALAGTVGRCSRVVTLVFTVTLHILTVSNCTESRPFPVHCLLHCRTGSWRLAGTGVFVTIPSPQPTFLLCPAVHPPTPGHQLQHHGSYTATPTPTPSPTDYSPT